MATKKSEKPSTEALKAKVEKSATAKADKPAADKVKVKLLRGCRAYGMSLVTTPVPVSAEKAEVLIKAGVAEAV